MLIPDARRAVTSFREERSPNAIRTATSTDMGTARTNIHERFRTTSSMITQAESPLPTSWSMYFMTNCSRKRNIRVPREKTKGPA